MRRRDVQQQLALRATFARAGASVMVAWAVAGDALGQTPGQQPPVQQVDTAAGDRHALSTSLRVMSVDLSPHNFERVYQVPGHDDLMMRTNGALYAVFEQSTYARDPQRRGALRAVIPAATVFYIGRPDFRVIRGTGIRDIDFVPHRGDRSDDAAHARREEGVAGHQRLDAEALQAVAHGMLHGAAAFAVLHHLGQRADVAEIGAPRLVDGGVLLQHDAQRRLARQRVLQRGQRGRSPDADGHQHVRKQHQVAHRHQGHHVRRQFKRQQLVHRHHQQVRRTCGNASLRRGAPPGRERAQSCRAARRGGGGCGAPLWFRPARAPLLTG